MSSPTEARAPVALSVVLPFYNEEDCVAQVITSLHGVLERERDLLGESEPFEIVAVQNGSRDRTGEVLAELAGVFPEVRVVEVPVNRGFGYGLLQGMAASRGGLIALMPGDGQVDPAYLPVVVRRMRETGCELGKIRRVVRHDGWQRRWVSRAYNLLTRLLFGLPTEDVNGHPKVFTRALYEAAGLSSSDSFLDPELMLKAQRLGVRFCEVDGEFRRRETGRSTVRWTTALEFLGHLLRARLDPDDPWGIHRLERRSYSPGR